MQHLPSRPNFSILQHGCFREITIDPLRFLLRRSDNDRTKTRMLLCDSYYRRVRSTLERLIERDFSWEEEEGLWIRSPRRISRPAGRRQEDTDNVAIDKRNAATREAAILAHRS